MGDQFMSNIRDSVETSVSMKFFNSITDSSHAHIFNSTLGKISIANCRKLKNFNPQRLQDSAEEAYPKTDRPRGNKDISSVKYHQKVIKNGNNLAPIWVLDNGELTLLDGAHRIVATYIENKRTISVYIIKI